jgi:hypothetical protein
MKESGVGGFTRQAMYLAVRVGGSGAWRLYADEKVAEGDR